jgi:hypothetical protein
VVKQFYVRELIVLLRELGIDHRAIADHLHVARSSVASWAGGQRAVPQRHLLDFVDLVAAAIEAACARAGEAPVETSPSLLHDGSARAQCARTLHAQLDRWEVELYKTSGRLAEEYQRHARLLLSYLHQDPDKLNQAERDQVKTAGYGIARTIRALAHFHNRPEETDGRILGRVRSDSPLVHFWELASRVNDEPERDAGAGSEEEPTA